MECMDCSVQWKTKLFSTKKKVPRLLLRPRPPRRDLPAPAHLLEKALHRGRQAVDLEAFRQSFTAAQSKSPLQTSLSATQPFSFPRSVMGDPSSLESNMALKE
ncbi:hypothetical protein DIPPA_03173 [Diplonema papillatum]|nr:hypothetical protein DIPPA_03173 [Diplonema papillatum]